MILKYNKFIFENTKWNYANNKYLDELISNARKYNNVNDFIEDYIDLQYIRPDKILDNIKKGDVINLVRDNVDNNGNVVYGGDYVTYKTVVSDKYYSDIWKFILDNTKELKEEAIKLYNNNKNNKHIKKFNNIEIGYHASPYDIDKFKYTDRKTSGQLGADYGFFFFKDENFAKHYAHSLKNSNDNVYIYTVEINKDSQLELNGEDVGTNWGRIGELEQASIEGYNSVIIHDADTGYGVTDEIIVFDDDNIIIIDKKEI